MNSELDLYDSREFNPADDGDISILRSNSDRQIHTHYKYIHFYFVNWQNVSEKKNTTKLVE